MNSAYDVIFDHIIPMPAVTWKRARSVGTLRFTDKKMQRAKQNLGWEIKAAAPHLRSSSTHRFGFRVGFFLAASCGGDGDNYEKLLMDALQGIIWENDAQVDAGSWTKHYNSDAPAIALTIWRWIE